MSGNKYLKCCVWRSPTFFLAAHKVLWQHRRKSFDRLSTEVSRSCVGLNETLPRPRMSSYLETTWLKEPMKLWRYDGFPEQQEATTIRTGVGLQTKFEWAGSWATNEGFEESLISSFVSAPTMSEVEPVQCRFLSTPDNFYGVNIWSHLCVENTNAW